MPAARCRRGARLAVVAAIALIPTACSSRKSTSTPSPSSSTSAASAVHPVASASGPMTGDELVWLDGIRRLHQTMDKILTDAPTPITTDSMGSLGDQFAGCTTALDVLSLPTDRLRPIYDLAKGACAQYEKAGTCFTTAATLGVVIAGSADEQKQRQAEDCGFAAPGDGSKLFADAETKGFELSEAAR